MCFGVEFSDTKTVNISNKSHFALVSQNIFDTREFENYVGIRMVNSLSPYDYMFQLLLNSKFKRKSMIIISLNIKILQQLQVDLMKHSHIHMHIYI
jgi:hypothetical protein